MKIVLVTLFLIFGIVFAAVGLARVVRRVRLRHRGSRTTGSVVRLRQASTADGTTFAPVVAFQAGGRCVEITGLFASPCFYRVGQRVPVCYPPAQPERGVILTWQEAAKAWGVLGAGAAFALIGVLLAVLA